MQSKTKFLFQIQNIYPRVHSNYQFSPSLNLYLLKLSNQIKLKRTICLRQSQYLNVFDLLEKHIHMWAHSYLGMSGEDQWVRTCQGILGSAEFPPELVVMASVHLRERILKGPGRWCSLPVHLGHQLNLEMILHHFIHQKAKSPYCRIDIILIVYVSIVPWLAFPFP